MMCKVEFSNVFKVYILCLVLQIRINLIAHLFKIVMSQWWQHFNKQDKQRKEETNSKFNFYENLIQETSPTKLGTCKTSSIRWSK